MTCKTDLKYSCKCIHSLFQHSGDLATVPSKNDSIDKEATNDLGEVEGAASQVKQPLQSDFHLPSLPIPTFSHMVKEHLEKGDAWTVWSKLIEELANYYDEHFPLRLNNSQDYQQIGMVMYAKYPCIARTGSNPWVSETVHSI